jgi:hypothetical protein
VAGPVAVHPLLPRFAQAVTGVISLEALLVGTWPPVAVALALVLLSLAGPRWSPVDWLFRLVTRPPAALVPAAPVRLSQAVTAVLLGAAVALLAAGADAAGWAIVAVVAALALLGAVTGLCLVCEAHRLLRREVSDVRPALGLEGSGPWLVLLTAPGCPGADALAGALAGLADGRGAVTVDLARRPQAAALAPRALPAALAVAPDGRVRETRAGRLGRGDLEAVAAAV